MKTFSKTGLWLCSLGLMLSACATVSTMQMALPRLGPPSGAALPNASEGTLIAYTEMIVEASLLLNREVYQNSSYQVLDETGRRILFVSNLGPELDVERPNSVSLPPGDYVVKALNAQYQPMYVPIRIEAGRTTVINLATGKPRRAPPMSGPNLVRLPTGEAAGFRVD